MEDLRKEIDRIDEELVKLFEERMNIVLKIAAYKKENHIPIFHVKREEEVIRKNMLYLKDSYYEKWAKEFLKNLMDISKSIQKEKILEKE
ncbi:chorismate mutase [Inediibacterium massiliense]|uniref:chorismate mutase n=1 Tax=Inediibacterium massiliense TaxID=1658111 RepID=UPI0006B3FCD7|nr:chorismate mutase [Inediibacterium massiliense]